MVLAVVVLAVATAIATDAGALLWRRSNRLSVRLRQTAPRLIRAGLAAEEFGPLTGLLDWTTVDRGVMTEKG